MSILSVTSNNRPSIFIGSSSEFESVAKAVKSNFDKEADVDVWNEDIFSKNKSFLSTLLNRASFYDFAIIVLTPDDVADIRDELYNIPRDNLYFELGLFMGRIGPYRTFIIADEQVKILTDFAGISISKFHSAGNLDATVVKACDEIRTEMKNAERQYRISLLPSTALAIGYYNNFIKNVLVAFQTMDEYEIFQRNQYDERINIKKKKIINRFPTITILLPEKLGHLESNIFKRKTTNLTKVHIQTGSRPYPFYLDGDIDDENNINFYDIPTTLTASLKTIDLVFDRDFLQRDHNREYIERREISNFEKTLRRQIPDGDENTTIKFEILK